MSNQEQSILLRSLLDFPENRKFGRFYFKSLFGMTKNRVVQCCLAIHTVSQIS